MRRLLLVLVLATTPLAAQKTRQTVALPGYREKFPIEDVSITFNLDAPMGKSMAAVRAAFDELKLPIDIYEPARGMLGQAHFNAQVSFAGYRLSRLLDCGTNSTGASYADTYRVTAALLVLFDSVDASHTRLLVGFVGGGEPASGARADAVQCGSKGVLEDKIIETAKKHLK